MTELISNDAVQRAEAAVLDELATCLRKPVVALPPETELFDAGLGLDSISFLDLILAIEKRLGVTLRSEDMTADTIATVGGLIRHVGLALSR